MGTVLKGHGVGKGIAEGEALVTGELVSNDNLSSGTYHEKGHEIDGVEVKGKVLVFPTGKGGSFVAHSLMGAKMGGVAPVAMVYDRVDSRIVDSTLLAGIPSVHSTEKSVVKSIKTGYRVRVDSDKGIVEIL